MGGAVHAIRQNPIAMPKKKLDVSMLSEELRRKLAELKAAMDPDDEEFVHIAKLRRRGKRTIGIWRTSYTARPRAGTRWAWSSPWRPEPTPKRGRPAWETRPR